MSVADKSSKQEGRAKRPLRDFGDRVKALTSEIDGDVDKIVQCMNKKKPVQNPKEEAVLMRQQIKELTLKLERNEQKNAAEIEQLNTALEDTQKTVATLAKCHTTFEADVHQLKKTTETQKRYMRAEIQQSAVSAQERTMRAVGEHMGQSHLALETKIDNVKEELKQELQCNEKLSNIEQMMASMLDFQKGQMLQASSQRFSSTSTLDTVGTADTGFCDVIPETQEDCDSETQDTRCCDSGGDGEIPTYIKDFGLKMETIVLRRVQHLARHLGIDHTCLSDMRDELDHRKDFQNLFWDVIAAWCQKCRRERKRIRLNDFLRAVDDAGIQRKVKPMPPTDRHIIEKNVPMLVERLIVDVLVVKLRGSGMLCPDDVNYIMGSNQQIEKVTRLVDLLSILGDQALDSLIKALNESEQKHIADAIIRSSPTRFTPVNTLHTEPKAVDRNMINRGRARYAWEVLQSQGNLQTVKESRV